MSLNRTLQALSDPTRRTILQLLNERDLTAGEIAAQFEMSAPSVSHHLSVLKGAELVRAERRGQTIVYALNATVMQEFLAELLRTFNVGAAQQRAEPEEDQHA
jgi:ArsR family transcriptional regulator, arsenate/arsenite/antimonite-responsive transcriptional repressor